MELKNGRHTNVDFARMKSALAGASKDSTRHVITEVLVEKNDDGITGVLLWKIMPMSGEAVNMCWGGTGLGVREYLVSLGVDGAVIQTRSYGEELPAVDGRDEQAWNKNRGVVFVVYWTALGFQEWEVITPLFLPSEG
jgi:hypothetical protein